MEGNRGIFNFLDTMTIEDCIKWAAKGYEIKIHRGHVQALILGGKR